MMQRRPLLASSIVTIKIIVLLAVIVAAIVPLYWMVVTSFKLPLAIGATPTLLPHGLSIINFRNLVTQGNILLNLRNSLGIDLSATIIVLVAGGLGGYAVAHLSPRWRQLALVSVLLFGLFPEIILIPGIYAIMRDLGWTNTWQSLILPYSAWGLPFAIWMSANYYAILPRELEEAALCDGAGWMRILRSVVLPVSKPILLSIAVFTFVAFWSEYLIANSVNTAMGTTTLSVGITMYGTQYQNATGEVLGAALISAIPVALLLIIFRKALVSGLIGGAVK